MARRWTHGAASAAGRRGPCFSAGAFPMALVVIALLLVVAAPAAFATSGKAGLVRGVVVTGPMPPVDRGSGPSWSPVKAVVKVFRHGQERAFRTLRTGDDGVFSVRLPAGTWRFSAAPAGPSTLPIPHDAVAKVRPGKTSRVRLWLDTGLQFPDAKDAGQSVEATATPPGTHRYDQGVVGATRRGPIVPVVRPGEPSDEPCDATLVFYRPDGRLVATVQSTAQDGFSASLPAGTYIVDARSTLSSFDRGGPFTLEVPRDQWLGLGVWFDTGIRFGGLPTAR